MRTDDVQWLDPVSRNMKSASSESWKSACGRFLNQDNKFYCYFVTNGELHLILNDQPVPVDQRTTSRIYDLGAKWDFQVYRNNEIVYGVKYPKKPLTDANPFWPSDAEDEDILLFIHNIISSKEKQMVIIDNNPAKCRQSTAEQGGSTDAFGAVDL